MENKMVTVGDLMVYLQRLPSDAVVEVVVDGCWEYLNLKDVNERDGETIYFSSMENKLFFGNTI
jgi:hypothetical protein